MQPLNLSTQKDRNTYAMSDVEKKIKELQKEKDLAVKEGDFHYAGILNIKITTLKSIRK